CAIEVVHAGRMLHETSRLEWNSFIRCEHISFARVPCSFEDRSVSVLAMGVRPAHHAGWEFDLDDVHARLCWITLHNSLFEAETVGLVHPFQLLWRDTNDTLRCFLAKDDERGEQQHANGER